MSKDNNLEFDILNKELIPLIQQYKNLQNVYLLAINNGGCFITINGTCKDDPIKTDHPYFLQKIEDPETIQECFKKQTMWQKMCNNKNINSIFLSKGDKDIIKQTEPITQQLNSLNTLIIDKFNQIQKSVENNESLQLGDKKNMKRDILGQIQVLLDERDKLTIISPEMDKSSLYKLNTNYLKFVFWLCLVILVFSVIYLIYSDTGNLIKNLSKLIFIIIGLYFSYNNIQILYIVIFAIILFTIYF